MNAKTDGEGVKLRLGIEINHAEYGMLITGELQRIQPP
jgi:hypothetical protein